MFKQSGIHSYPKQQTLITRAPVLPPVATLIRLSEGARAHTHTPARTHAHTRTRTHTPNIIHPPQLVRAGVYRRASVSGRTQRQRRRRRHIRPRHTLPQQADAAPPQRWTRGTRGEATQACHRPTQSAISGYMQEAMAMVGKSCDSSVGRGRGTF